MAKAEDVACPPLSDGVPLAGAWFKFAHETLREEILSLRREKPDSAELQDVEMEAKREFIHGLTHLLRPTRDHHGCLPIKAS